MENKKIIELKNVGIAYKAHALSSSGHVYWATKDVSFSVYSGECIGIVGRNGAGKSTLLKALAGIINPDKGTVELKKGIVASLLTLQLGFSRNLTGRDNAILSGILLGKKRKEVERQMDEIIRFSELGEFIDEPLSTYSSGMKARLGFSVAIISKPDMLLIDEVIGVGDAGFKVRSAKVIEDLVSSDRTAVIVSHNTDTIRKLCNRVVWIENGEVVMEDSSDAVLDKYVAYNRAVSALAQNTNSTEKEVRERVSLPPLEALEVFIKSMEEIGKKE